MGFLSPGHSAPRLVYFHSDRVYGWLLDQGASCHPLVLRFRRGERTIGNHLQAPDQESRTARQTLRRSILLCLLCLVSIGLLVMAVIAMLHLLPTLRVHWWDEWYIWLGVLLCGLLFVAAFGIAVKELVLAWKRFSASRPR